MAEGAFSLYQGEDKSIPISIRPPQNTAGWTMRFRMVRSSDGFTITKDNASLGGVVMVDAASGMFRVDFAEEDTVNLAAGIFSWDFRRIDDGDNGLYNSGSVYLLPAT